MPHILSALRYITKCNDIRYLAVIFLLMIAREKQRVARNLLWCISHETDFYLSLSLVHSLLHQAIWSLVLIWFPCLLLSSLSHQHHREHRCGLFQQSFLKQCMCCLICWWVYLPEELVSIQTLCGVNFISASFSHRGAFIFKDRRTFSSWISLMLNSSCSPS